MSTLVKTVHCWNSLVVAQIMVQQQQNHRHRTDSYCRHWRGWCRGVGGGASMRNNDRNYLQLNPLFLINWMNQFWISGLLGSKFKFHSNFRSTPCKQTVQNLIRRCGTRRTQRLIWFCTVCRWPIKRPLGLNGFKLFSLRSWSSSRSYE